MQTCYFILALRLSKMEFLLKYGKVTTKGALNLQWRVPGRQAHGRGIMIYKNGRKFENFGGRQGHGTITNADGNILRGIWRDNELSVFKNDFYFNPEQKRSNVVKIFNHIFLILC